MKRLYAHAYAVHVKEGKEVLDPFFESALNHVRARAREYDQVILLGGWHNQELGVNRLLSDVALEQIRGRFQTGLPPGVFFTPSSFKLLGQLPYLPTRSTEEEIIHVRAIEAYLTTHGAPSTLVCACMIDFFAPKAVWYYRKLGVNLGGLELVAPPPVDPITALSRTERILGSLKSLQEHPELDSPAMLAHLASRTLDDPQKYYRPDPQTYFANTANI